MRLEYTEEQEKQLRIAELEAILENEPCEQSIRWLSLEVELQFLQGWTNSYGEPLANIEINTGEMLEIIYDKRIEQYSMLIYDTNGNARLPYYIADTVEELLEEVCEY